MRIVCLCATWYNVAKRPKRIELVLSCACGLPRPVGRLSNWWSSCILYYQSASPALHCNQC